MDRPTTHGGISTYHQSLPTANIVPKVVFIKALIQASALDLEADGHLIQASALDLEADGHAQLARAGAGTAASGHV